MSHAAGLIALEFVSNQARLNQVHSFVELSPREESQPVTRTLLHHSQLLSACHALPERRKYLIIAMLR